VSSDLLLPPLLIDAPVAVASLDLQGRLVDANHALLRAGGYTIEDLRGRSFTDFVDPVSVSDARARFDALASGPVQSYRVLQRYRFGSGEMRDIDLTVSLVRDDNGRPAGCLAVLQDITEYQNALREAARRATELEASELERERLLREAQVAQRELEAASRMKDEFLSVLSHELRTPLNAVLGWARILRMRPVGEQTAHAVAVIERNAVAQARLIDDLLDLAGIITGRTRLTLDDVDVGAVASGAMESVRPAAEAKRIAIALEIPEPLPKVSADPDRLQQVFWNLLSNAVKFTEPGGTVSVSVVADDNRVTARVTDTGIGVPSSVLPLVFDRFTQGDSSSTRVHSGLGLGLAIVRHLVELHGGTVQVSSEGPGLGATFGFSIPRREGRGLVNSQLPTPKPN
jgi:PAS domain S-box-containing protein